MDTVALNCLVFEKISLLHFDVSGPVMGSLKSPCATSYTSSIDTIALKWLVLEKIAFFLYFGDRQTDRQTDRWTPPMH